MGLEALGFIGQGLAGIGSLIGGIGNIAIGSENLKAQQEKLEWDKKAQYATWDREDNAVQRRMADLKSAGLNPVLAAGSAAQTSSPVHVEAPQRAPLPDLSAPGKHMAQSALDYLALISAKENISNTIAQRDLIKSNQQKAQAEADMARYSTDYYVDKKLPPPPAQGHIWKELLPWAQGIDQGIVQPIGQGVKEAARQFLDKIKNFRQKYMW